MPRLVASTPIGEDVRIDIVRNGRSVELTVRIGKQGRDAGSPEDFIEKKLGVRSKTITPEIANQFGIMDGGGILVTRLSDDTPEKDRLRQGDIIVEANRERVMSVGEFAEILMDLKEGDSILMLVRRPQAYQYVTMKVK